MNFALLNQLQDRRPEWFIEVGPIATHAEAWWACENWPKVRILGLQPCGERFATCLDHGFPGTLLKCAAWSHDEQTMSLSADESRSARSLCTSHRSRESEKVSGRSLDSLHEEIGPFDPCVICAEIDGTELRLLQGSVGLLSRAAVLALFLKRSQDSNSGGCVNEDVDDFLESYGYAYARQDSPSGRDADALYLPRNQ